VTDQFSVRVPATSANLGPGFDALGLALGWYDEVSAVRLDGPGVELAIDGVGADDLPRDEQHLVVRAIAEAFRAADVPRPGLSIRCQNRIPHGRGLGSSAAAVVAGVLLGQALIGAGERSQDASAALAIATRMEGHPDNAAAALLGGVTVAWSDGERPVGDRASAVHAVRMDPAPTLAAVVLVPEATLRTELARGMLPQTVPHRDAAHAAGRSALLVHALTSDPSLLLAATEDRLHQPYRAPSMPETISLVERLRSAGHAAVVSGAGPSVLVLGSAPLDRDGLSAVAGPAWAAHAVDLDRRGAQVAAGRGTAP
jgi:homoserine kinase